MNATRESLRAESLVGVQRPLRSLDPVLVLVAVALMVFGIVAVYAAAVEGYEGYAFRQVTGIAVGLAGAIPLAIVDYRLLKLILKPLYITALVLLVAVLLIGSMVNGAQSWIDFGPVSFQPSEFAKLLVVVALAGFLADNSVGRYMNFLKTLGIAAAPVALIFLQPDLGTAMVFVVIFLVMAFIGGMRLLQLGSLALAGGGLSFLAVKLGVLKDYQIARFTAFLGNGGGDASYQVVQSKVAIGSGGFFGKGLDATTLATLGYLPEDYTDLIFANLAERVGFIGCAFLIGLFFILIWRILRTATISRDRFGVLICVGVAAIFLSHVFVNIGMAMGLTPVTGIPLPFISYGRSNLVMSLLALALVQNVAMRSKEEASKRPAT